MNYTRSYEARCAKKIVVCSNKGKGCTLSVAQQIIGEHHVSIDCEYTEVAYENLGCGVRIMRKDTEKQEKEDREKHMDMSLAALREV